MIQANEMMCIKHNLNIITAKRTQNGDFKMCCEACMREEEFVPINQLLQQASKVADQKRAKYQSAQKEKAKELEKMKKTYENLKSTLIHQIDQIIQFIEQGKKMLENKCQDQIQQLEAQKNRCDFIQHLGKEEQALQDELFQTQALDIMDQVQKYNEKLFKMIEQETKNGMMAQTMYNPLRQTIQPQSQPQPIPQAEQPKIRFVTQIPQNTNSQNQPPQNQIFNSQNPYQSQNLQQPIYRPQINQYQSPVVVLQDQPIQPSFQTSQQSFSLETSQQPTLLGFQTSQQQLVQNVPQNQPIQIPPIQSTIAQPFQPPIQILPIQQTQNIASQPIQSPIQIHPIQQTQNIAQPIQPPIQIQEIENIPQPIQPAQIQQTQIQPIQPQIQPIQPFIQPVQPVEQHPDQRIIVENISQSVVYQGTQPAQPELRRQQSEPVTEAQVQQTQRQRLSSKIKILSSTVPIEKKIEYEAVSQLPIDQCEAMVTGMNDKYFVSGKGTQLMIWKLDNGQLTEPQEINAHHVQITCLCFSKTSDWFISGFYDGQAKVWQYGSEWTSTQTISLHKKNIRQIILNNQEDQLISCNDNMIKVFVRNDISKQWQCFQTLIESGFQILFLSLTPNGNFLASTDYNGKFQIFSREPTKMFKEEQKLEIPDGNKYIRICFIDDNELIATTENEGKIVHFQYQNLEFKIAAEYPPLGVDENNCGVFPIIYNTQLKVAIIRHNNSIQIVGKLQNGQLSLKSVINGNYWVGELSQNGQNLFMWSKDNKSIMVWKLI